MIRYVGVLTGDADEFAKWVKKHKLIFKPSKMLAHNGILKDATVVYVWCGIAWRLHGYEFRKLLRVGTWYINTHEVLLCAQSRLRATWRSHKTTFPNS